MATGGDTLLGLQSDAQQKIIKSPYRLYQKFIYGQKREEILFENSGPVVPPCFIVTTGFFMAPKKMPATLKRSQTTHCLKVQVLDSLGGIHGQGTCPYN